MLAPTCIGRSVKRRRVHFWKERNKYLEQCTLSSRAKAIVSDLNKCSVYISVLMFRDTDLSSLSDDTSVSSLSATGTNGNPLLTFHY